MATTIVTKSGSGAPTASDLVAGELAVDLTNGRLYTEDSGGTVLELGLNPNGNVDVTGSVTAGGIAVDVSADSDSVATITSTATANNTQLRLGTNGNDSVISGSGGSNGALAFKVFGSERMRIDSSGNVQQATSVNGDLHHHIYNANTGTSAEATLYVSNGATSSGLFAGATGTNFTTAGGFVQDGAHIGSGSSAAGGLSIITRASAPIRFYTNGHTNERMRIDASGNLLVGKTASGTANTGAELRNGSSNHAVVATSTSETPLVVNRKTNDGSLVNLLKDGTSVGAIGTLDGNSIYIGNGDVNLRMIGVTNKIVPATSAGANRDAVVNLGDSNARFKDLYLSGVANVGGTAKFASWSNVGASNGIEIRSADGQILNSHTGTTLHNHQYFYNANGAVGSISTNGSATAYNTSSDYRLKENVVAMTGATERLKQLNPSRFNFIADADTTVDGFLAHEVQDIVPEAISGTKDAMRDEEYEVTPAVLDDDGNVTTEAVMGTRSVPDYQGIDQSKLVPLLVATIQELEARITQLENN